MKRTIKYYIIIPPNSQGLAQISSHHWNLSQISLNYYKPEITFTFAGKALTTCCFISWTRYAVAHSFTFYQVPSISEAVLWLRVGALAQISRVDSHFCVNLASIFSSVWKKLIIVLPHWIIVMIENSIINHHNQEEPKEMWQLKVMWYAG